MDGTSGDIAIPNSSNSFDVSESWVERVAVVAVSGDLDMLTAPKLAEAICAAQRKGPTALIVDLTEVTFLATAGMNLLLITHRETKLPMRFGVIAAGSSTRRHLTLIGIDTEVAVYDSLDDGLDAFADS